MPIYEYYCPQHGRFECLQNMKQRHSTLCPKCNTKSKLVPSVFAIYKLNWTQTDGEGFSTRHVRDGELKEMRREYAH